MPGAEGDGAAGLRRREERPADAGFRYELFCQSRPPGEDFSFLAPAMRETLLRQQFIGQTASYRASHPAARHEILEAEGRPIGRIVYDRGSQAILILDLAFLNEFRNQGLGARMLAEICAEAQAAGIAVRFHSFLSNVHANRLFLRLGFAPIAQTELQILWERPAETKSASPLEPEHASPTRNE